MDIMEIIEEQNPWWRDPSARPGRLPASRRDSYDILLKAVLDRSNRRATVLMGPRQVGKTTVMKQVLQSLLERGWPPGNITLFDLADDRLGAAPDPREILKQRPASFREDRPQVLFLDELQRYSGWGDWLRREVDKGEVRVFATGSSMSLLRDGGVETGQGRWDEFRMEGMTFRETLRLHGDEQTEEQLLLLRPQLFERFLKTGGMPEFALREPSSEMRARLREDIASKAIVRDLARAKVETERVKDLFVYLVRDSGSIFNAQQRGADMGANRKSVTHWVDLLKDTGLLVGLPRYLVPGGGKASRQLNPKPKVYAADHGLIDVFWPGQGAAVEELRGQVFEAVVFRQLRRLAQETPEMRLSYLREGDLEVDFIVEVPGQRIAVEVTGSDRCARKWPALGKVRDRAQLDRVVLVHGGSSHKKDGLQIEVPLRSFLLDPRGVVLGDRS